MNETIDYAEMLEIPVSTLNVTKKRSKKRREELKDRVVEAVNERMEGAEEPAREEDGVTAADNLVDYGENAAPRPKRRFLESRLLVGEFVAVLALCATILLTNIFWQESAINTFFANILSPSAAEDTVDERVYSELTPSSVVSDPAVVCSVGEDGVLTFTAACSVYAPCDGSVANVTAAEDGTYTVEIAHTSTFSTILSGLTYAYCAAGDEVLSTIPVGYSDGAAAVSVAMYDAGTLIRAYTVGENNDILWNA